MRVLRTGSKAWRLAVGAVLLAALAPATAQATNSVPYADSFESYAPGTGLVSSNVALRWYGAAEAGLVVRAKDNTYPLRMPLPNATHSNVLELLEPSTNMLNHAGGDTNVWIDCVVYPVRSAMEPELDDDIQLALYFNSEGHVVIRHRYYTPDLYAPLVWTELQHAPLPTDQWVRVTIKLDYLTASYPEADWLDAHFQVYLNGGAALTNERGLVSIPFPTDTWPLPSSLFGGSWFMMANAGAGVVGPNKLSSLEFKGSGFIDDLVITNGDSLVAAPDTWTIEATTGTGGTIYPAGMLSVAEGQDLTFTVYEFENYVLADVLVDGYSVGATNSYTFNTVTTNHTISASFTAAPSYTSKGINKSWMDLHGLTNYEIDQDLDQDSDDALTWEEYVAGTDPTNSASVFRVIDVSYLGSQNRVRWYGTMDSGVTEPFSMLRSTNLNAAATNAWELIESNSLPRASSGTNVYWDVNVPSNAPAYYRPMVLWNL